jgi:hypothetical protein
MPLLRWERPAAAAVAAQLRPQDPGAGCTVLIVPAASLERAWRRSRAGMGSEAPGTSPVTTGASVALSRLVQTMRRDRTAQTPVVRYAEHPPRLGASGIQEPGELVFVDGQDTFAAALVLGVSFVEVVVPTAEVHRFLLDVGGSVVGALIDAAAQGTSQPA